MLPNDHRAPFFRRSWVRVQNAAQEVIPPYAVMRITGGTSIDGEIVYTVAKPNATKQRWYLVNGMFQIANSSTAEGVATFLTNGGFVLYDTGDGTPANGETWGAENGQWSLAKGKPGFTMLAGNQGTVGANSFSLGIQEQASGAVRIQIWAGGEYDEEGDLLEPDEDGYHPARLITHVGDDVEVGETVKAHVMDWHDSDQGEGPGAIVENGRFYMGILEGTQDGTPRVTIELGHVTYTGQPEDDIEKGGSGIVRLYNGDETDSGLTVTAKALGMGVFEDNWVQVSRWAGGAWYVGCWEF